MQDKKLNVLVDFHHASLLNSLILLFEKRLGGKIYRPIGIEWAQQGFWKVYDHPETQAQYLGIGSATPDGSAKLNEVVKNPQEGVYHCYDIDSGETNKAVTLGAFLRTSFDIVIASMPVHVEPFKKLCELHPNKPKLIYQIGNSWDNSILAPNIMASAKISGIPQDINFIEYHQEFNIDYFQPNEPSKPDLLRTWDDSRVSPKKNIYSFVNVFNGQDHFKEDWRLFENIEHMMYGWSFKSFGGQCRDGAIGPAKKVASKMKESKFIWHTKVGGDGYGHVIHNAFAVGRPPIVKMEQYRGKLAEDLMEDGVTCIAIDNLSNDEIVNKIEHYSELRAYEKLCKGAYDRFKQVVNFDKEQIKIQEFLANLK